MRAHYLHRSEQPLCVSPGHDATHSVDISRLCKAANEGRKLLSGAEEGACSYMLVQQEGRGGLNGAGEAPFASGIRKGRTENYFRLGVGVSLPTYFVN
jgi:hypothetical protein